MTEPDWKNVTPQPLGYIYKHDAEILSALSDGRCVSLFPASDTVCKTETDRYAAVYLAPIVPTEQPGQPQPHMQGYSECKQWTMDVIEDERQIYQEGGPAWCALTLVLETLRQNEAAR